MQGAEEFNWSTLFDVRRDREVHIVEARLDIEGKPRVVRWSIPHVPEEPIKGLAYLIKTRLAENEGINRIVVGRGNFLVSLLIVDRNFMFIEMGT